MLPGARDGWLHLARALNQVDTDTVRHLATAAGEAGDLALCTARLAYADPPGPYPAGPAWPPDPAPARRRPGSRRRPAGRRPPRLRRRDQPGPRPARADKNRGRRGSAPGPHRSLPDTMDIPRPFAPALPGHVHALLHLCQETAQASAEAPAQAGEATATVRVSSNVLTVAAAAARDAGTSPQHPAAPELAVTGQPGEGPAGATQAALRRLGVSSPDLLQRAAGIDRANEQLIIEAAGRSHQPASGHQHEPPEAQH